jgi:hypothetical protein
MPINDDDTPVPRYGHTAVYFKRDVYIYGGTTPFISNKTREDILIYSIGM